VLLEDIRAGMAAVSRHCPVSCAADAYPHTGDRGSDRCGALMSDHPRGGTLLA
jgi:hypothetical protein